jgi:hypothetical protein
VLHVRRRTDGGDAKDASWGFAVNIPRSATQPLESRLQDILTVDFIATTICPLLPELSHHRPSFQDVSASLVQNTGTGRITVEYQLGSQTVFGKLYTDDLGVHSYAVLQRLWDDEFGTNEEYRVCEPLAYLRDYRLLLTHKAPGVSLDSLAIGGEVAFARGLRGAARWLAKLHDCALRIGQPEALWVKFLKLGRSIAKTSHKGASQSEELIHMMATFERLAHNVSDRPIAVQTHGRFLPDHIFIDNGTVMVIDLDRSSPSDAAQDLAELLYSMRLRAFKLACDQTRSAVATALFLEEYTSHLPRHVNNLTFFWAYNILYSLSRFMRHHTPDEPVWQPMVTFAMNEFDEISSGTLPGCSFR